MATVICKNSALDGSSHLVMTATLNTNTSLKCNSSPNADGTCYATSARLRGKIAMK